MRLREITELLITARIVGDGNMEFSGIETDSRLVANGQLFVCVSGERVDGHNYAQEAVLQGAAAIVTERELELDVPQLLVKDSRFALTVIAHHYYSMPSLGMKLIGVTGTNGKTTTTYLIESILNNSNRWAGVMGTIEMRYGGRAYPVSGTTPHAPQLQRYLSEMRDAGMQ